MAHDRIFMYTTLKITNTEAQKPVKIKKLRKVARNKETSKKPTVFLYVNNTHFKKQMRK